MSVFIVFCWNILSKKKWKCHSFFFWASLLLYFFLGRNRATLIQAYRARNLPDNYSESMTILYSSFSAAVFLGIFFPLYYSQESDQARMHVQWIILSSVGLILTLSMYARKIFIIVFQAEKNTMKAWNRKRLQYSMEAHESMSCISGPVINSEETFVWKNFNKIYFSFFFF